MGKAKQSHLKGEKKTICHNVGPFVGFPGGAVIKVPPVNAGGARDLGSIPGFGRSPGEGNGSPPILLPGKFHGQRNLEGSSPWGRKESDRNEYVCVRPHTHTQGPLCSSHLSSSP